MSIAEHVISWAENSASHYRKMQRLSVPGFFMTEHARASAAYNFASQTIVDMCRAGDLQRSEVRAMDILVAAGLALAWRVEP